MYVGVTLDMLVHSAKTQFAILLVSKVIVLHPEPARKNYIYESASFALKHLCSCNMININIYACSMLK